MVANINGDPMTRMAFCWFTNEGVTDGEVQLLPVADATASDFEAGAGVITLPATPTTTKALRYAVSRSGIIETTGCRQTPSSPTSAIRHWQQVSPRALHTAGAAAMTVTGAR